MAVPANDGCPDQDAVTRIEALRAASPWRKAPPALDRRNRGHHHGASGDLPKLHSTGATRDITTGSPGDPVKLADVVHLVRVSRGAAVVAVIVWQLAALVLLPAALCCHAAIAHDGGEEVPACCKGVHDGAACPMNRGPDAASGMDQGSGHGKHGTAHGKHDAARGKHENTAHGKHGTAHGKAEADRGWVSDARPRLHGCHLLDDTLLALAGLAGLTSETFRIAWEPAASARLADTRVSAASLHGPPATPPPRV